MAAGEYQAVARVHAIAYLALAEGLDSRWEATPNRDWLAEAILEVENWRAALNWGLAARGDLLVGSSSLRSCCGSIWD